MNGTPNSLVSLQKWMHAVITHLDGVESGIDSDAARSQIPVSVDEVDDVILRSKALTSVERLNVYANAYFVRLLDCLAEEYPALVHALGKDAFDGLAVGFLADCPSESYTLGELGARFPRYLEETRPPREEDDTPDWADFLIDLAKLQRAYSEVFDGPGFENSELLSSDELLAIPAGQWDRVRFVTVPCLRLETFRFPVHEYASAVRNEEEAVFPDTQATLLAISRVNYRVRRWALSEVQFRLLGSIVAGETLGEAISAAIAGGDVEIDAVAAQLRDWFEEWTANGFFASVHVDAAASRRA